MEIKKNMFASREHLWDHRDTGRKNRSVLDETGRKDSLHKGHIAILTFLTWNYTYRRFQVIVFFICEVCQMNKNSLYYGSGYTCAV